MDGKPCLVVIAGPTASGKTAFAIRLALLLNTEIISADSRQIYKELTIGAAKPSPQELAQVPHHFINHISIHTPYNANIFEHEVIERLKQLFKTHQTVIMAGGSGLYINAVLNGIAEYPSIPPEIRRIVIAEYEKYGLTYLQEIVKQIDNPYFQQADIKNPRRLMHAIEVFRTSGKPYSYWLSRPPKKRPFCVKKIMLSPNREELYNRINTRVDYMIKNGLLHEAEQLFPFKHLLALKTVGYQEIFRYMEGSLSKEEAIAEIKKNTRRYAKRQFIWFKKHRFFEIKNIPQNFDDFLHSLHLHN